MGIPCDRKPVGTIVLRWPTEKPRAWVKVADPDKWKLRCTVVWEKVNGPLPIGKCIHHMDSDPTNDDISNLQALTPSEHSKEHIRLRRIAKQKQCASG